MLLAINGELTGIQVLVADTFRKRLIGLIGNKKPVNGLLFRSCNSIHTFFMHCPIDAVFIDLADRVTDITTIRPWQAILPKKRVRSILELPAGTASALRLKPGDAVTFV